MAFQKSGCRMEKVDFSTPSTIAKAFGTLVSILGAFMLTLYKGPQILTTSSSLKSVSQLLDIQESDWVIGGVLFTVDCFAASAFIIVQVQRVMKHQINDKEKTLFNDCCFSTLWFFQAFILKHFPAELIIVFFYCFFAAILSALVSLITEKDLSSWTLQPSVRHLAVLYSVSKGTPVLSLELS